MGRCGWVGVAGSVFWTVLLAGCGGGGASDDGAARPQEQIEAKALVAVAGSGAAQARWSAPVKLNIVPVGASVLANGKVLFWAADSQNNFGGNGHTFTTLFDPSSNTAADRDVSETGHDMFCPGIARLPDGRLLVNGGLDVGTTSLYNPADNSWARGPSMNVGRAYNASVALADGSVMTLGGSWKGANGGVRPAELFTLAGGWRTLAGIPEDPFRLDGSYQGWQSDAHYAMFPTANGKVLLAGPTPDMAWLDPRGNGSWTPAGRRGDDIPSFAGSWAMYDAGKILKAGGATWNNGPAANANTYQIDTTGGGAAVRKLASMAYPRVQANSVVLPNGQVVVIGGQTTAKEFSDDYAVLAPELWDPATETFSVLPPMAVARNYHSVAVLLPDARVVSAGGGLCACAADHMDLQVLSPPYLFNADGTAATRPAFVAAPLALTYGSTVNVTTDSPVAAFSLVRMGANTHTVNNDQRRIALGFTRLAGNGYQLAIPSNPGILLPGQWMLFALDAKGTPSLARIVTVDAAGAPVLQNPGNVEAGVGQPASFRAIATTPRGTIVYSATGLPPGWSIDPATGIVSGTPVAAGSSVVSISANNGLQTVSTDVVISATTVGTGTGLLGQYFAGTTPGGPPAVQRTEAVDFAWGEAAPAPGLPADNFSARWTGSLEPAATGATQLRTVSDDGVRVWVDNQLVIDNWAPHGPTADTVTLNLTAGKRYLITIDYYEAREAATMRLQWQPPGAAGFTPVPANRLYAGAVPAPVNLALGKTAMQSSVYEAAGAQRAVDGNTSGLYSSGSMTHTAALAPQDWWQVDLGRVSRIDSVTLWNRTDCCSDRLANAVLLVSTTDMAGRSFDQLRADPAVVRRQVGAGGLVPAIGVPVGANGRFVRVQLPGANYLSLAEVQVFGTAVLAYRTPTIEPIGDQQAVQGAATSMTARATDADGNPLTYSATGLPPGVFIGATTGLVSGVPTAAGVYGVTIAAANEGNLSASTRFTWTVLGAVPAVAAFAKPLAVSGSAVAYSPTLGAGAAAQVTWDFGDGTNPVAAAGASVSHVFASAGIYTVTMTVRTADGRSSTQRFLQAVQPRAGAIASATAGANVGVGASPAVARASSALALEPRGTGASRLWVVNADNDSVSVFDTAGNAKLGEIAVGTDPRTVAVGPDGRVWVVNKRSASISIVDPATLAVRQTVALPRGSQPYGIVFSPAGGGAFVSLEASGQLLRLDTGTGSVVGSLAVGDNPRHLAFTPSGDRLLVSRFITRPLPGEGTARVQTVDATGAKVGGEVLVVDPAAMAVVRTVVLAVSQKPDSENQGRGLPNYLGAAAIAPDGKTAWVPGKQDNVLRGGLRDGQPLNFQNTVRSISSRIDLGSLMEDLAGRIDHDNSGLASAAVYHPGGAYLFVALETSREVAVLDAAGKRELFRFDVGLAPQSVLVSADGLKLFVGNFMGRSVSVVDLQPLVSFGQAGSAATDTLNSVGTEKLPATVLLGKQLFYDARDTRLARDGYMSCASCHNDAAHDGRTWDMTSLGEGLRNTAALRGRAGMGQGFVHWSANFDEIQDFEGQIRMLAGGTGLMGDAAFNAGTRNQPLGDSKAGLSADLDALAAYLSSLSAFAPSPWRAVDGGLTPAAQLGKTVFTSANCAACHGGAAFTASGNAALLKDVGTLKASSGQRLGGPLTGIDIPTLRDVWATAPYLHDGSAPTLAAAVTSHNNVALNPADLANLVAYLQQIGSDETAAPGRTAVGPVFGAAAGAGFTDTVAPGQQLTGVVVRAGWWIDSVQALASPANLAAHGGTGGGVYTATWPAGEYLVRVSGQWGSGGVIGQIRFTTNTGRVLGPYGISTGIGNLTAFDYSVPAGNRVLGFTGRAGNALNAVGVVYGP